MPLLAGLGLLWAAFWFLWFRDKPQFKRGVSVAELEYIQDEPAGTAPKHGVTRLAYWGMFFFS